MRCACCGGARTLTVHAKVDDRCAIRLGDRAVQMDGYVPGDVGLGSVADYISLAYCLDCGQLDGDWPMRPTAFEKAIAGGGR